MLKPDFTDYKLNENIIPNIVVLVDTREQENSHIIKYFDRVGVKHKSRKLDFGDYGLMLPKNEKFGIMYDMILDFAVERKGCLEELSGNLTNARTRIEEEFFRGKEKMALVLENGSIDMILKGDYNTKYNKNSYIGTLMAFCYRYNISYWFVSQENSGKIILALLKYKLKEVLK